MIASGIRKKTPRYSPPGVNRKYGTRRRRAPSLRLGASSSARSGVSTMRVVTPERPCGSTLRDGQEDRVPLLRLLLRPQVATERRPRDELVARVQELAASRLVELVRVALEPLLLRACRVLFDQTLCLRDGRHVEHPL